MVSRLLRSLVITSLFTPALAAIAAPPRHDNAQPLSRIAFGSCVEQDEPQPVWASVLAVSPELMILLGDNVYADTEDMAVPKGKYARNAAEPGK